MIHKSMNKVELLSPAGNFEKLKTAVRYGADAVYLAGKEYGLRSFAENFTLDEMRQAIHYAHEHGVKTYVTLNVFAHQRDLDGLKQKILQIEAAGADAVIVSDCGVFSLVRCLAPDLSIHISTQSSVTNSESCMFWHKVGAKRIVLARELSLEEIKMIRTQVPQDLELEVFIHGSMCMTYSGRCLLSAYFTGRDANRGACVQPCRWKYTVVEETRPDQQLTWNQDDRGSYIFSSKDLCMIDHIPELIDAGINSFKIEGRMKGIYYVATATKAYREAIDTYYKDPGLYKADPVWKNDLSKTVHREFDTGFFFEKPMRDAKIAYEESYIREAKIAGIVLSYDARTKRAIIEQRNKITEGDKVEIVSPKGRHSVIRARDLRNENNEKIETTPHPQMTYSMKMPLVIAEQSFLRILSK
jgi:U32 family peptidase